MNDRRAVVERVIFIAAPPEVVFGFLSDPALMAQWIGLFYSLEPRGPSRDAEEEDPFLDRKLSCYGLPCRLGEQLVPILSGGRIQWTEGIRLRVRPETRISAASARSRSCSASRTFYPVFRRAWSAALRRSCLRR